MSEQDFTTTITQSDLVSSMAEEQSFTVVEPLRETLSNPADGRVTTVIPTGAKGDKGEKGDKGDPGQPGTSSNASYVHTQNSPSAVWTVNHNLGFHPAVTVQDSAGATVEGELTYDDADNLTLTFTAAFGGVAYLS